MKELEKKVEVTLEVLLGFCQEKSDRVKELRETVKELVNEDNIQGCSSIESWLTKLGKARESHARAHSQLIGMLELAQAIYDPDDQIGYFMIDTESEKVIFELYENGCNA